MPARPALLALRALPASGAAAVVTAASGVVTGTGASAATAPLPASGAPPRAGSLRASVATAMNVPAAATHTIASAPITTPRRRGRVEIVGSGVCTYIVGAPAVATGTGCAGGGGCAAPAHAYGVPPADEVASACAAKRSSSDSTCAIVCGRSSASFASIARTSKSTPGGTSGTSWRRSGTGDS